ncbi:MAG: hypothetical protein J2P17_28215, partial [Mycobacterium sp.]|nr:hypothetical protein [Mycobacterium sp.]
GTGYNAAVLAECVGTRGVVVTSEIDTEIAAGATRAVRRWPTIAVITDDTPRRRVFDRIIVTAGVQTLHPTWFCALSNEGVLVANLEGPLANAMVRFQRAGNDFVGTIPALASVSFVPLIDISARRARPRVDVRDPGPLCIAGPEIPSAALDAIRNNNRDFLMLLQLLEPTWRFAYMSADSAAFKVLVDENTHSMLWIPLDPTLPTPTRGEGDVASRLVTAYLRWSQWGSPTISDYTLTYRPAQQRLTVTTHAGNVTSTQFLPTSMPPS